MHYDIYHVHVGSQSGRSGVDSATTLDDARRIARRYLRGLHPAAQTTYIGGSDYCEVVRAGKRADRRVIVRA